VPLNERPAYADRVELVPDTKDWTWVLRRSCPACGFTASDVAVTDLAARTRATVPPWQRVLARPSAAVRPAPAVWSPLEYACHVRDVYRLFDRRLRLMLDRDDPTFEDWDQDETAVRDRYREQGPAIVGAHLVEAGEAIAATFDGVPAGAWSRSGRRSNGSVFAVASLGRYFLHDVVHHLHDVAADPAG
jgi:hypothetical protein